MTDRIHSCKHSPNGRHRFTVSPLLCDYCARTATYLTDMGWNAPAVDPDWVDQEADVNDARIVWRVVNTDNFGSDYPNEKFVGGEFYTEAAADAFAEEKNAIGGDYASRYYKVVQMPYELAPGFEP